LIFRKKELPERIIGKLKSIMYSSLISIQEWKVIAEANKYHAEDPVQYFVVPQR